MAVEIISVRKKNNHGLTRSIKSSALSTFEKRGWEAIPGQTISAPVEVKKKEDVKPAEDLADDVDITPEGISDDPFAQIDEPEGERTLDDLRQEYKEVSGKDADKRWKAERLNDEISKLSNGN